MRERPPSPSEKIDGRREVYCRYLDYFREEILATVASFSPDGDEASLLPSDWTTYGLLRHLAFVERRWLVWGFLGEDVGEPFADRREGQFFVEATTTLDELVADLRRQGATSSDIIRSHELDERAPTGPRFEGDTRPTLERILLYLIQEYARHAGQLDVVVELGAAARSA